MLMRPGLRIALAIAFVVIVLIATWIAVGSENNGGLVTNAVRPASDADDRSYADGRAMAGKHPSAPASATSGSSIPEAEALLYEQDSDDILVDEATGVEPSADLPPEPMVVPEGNEPEPMLGPDDTSGF